MLMIFRRDLKLNSIYVLLSKTHAESNNFHRTIITEYVNHESLNKESKVRHPPPSKHTVNVHIIVSPEHTAFPIVLLID